MEATVKYPVGIQTFSEIREGGYVYVDKTADVYRLANAGKYFFLARPRRFGKSLLLTTLQAYFEGRKELFDGLAMERLEHDWHRHPVILLSLSTYNPSDPNLEAILNNNLFSLEKKYGVDSPSEDISQRFRNLIEGAVEKTGEKVVILIDEYDTPLVAHLEDAEKHEKVRNLLKSVYVNLKEMDSYIRFAMLTGVSRFSRMTIFSGLNNLNDITLNPEYGEICGITEAELESNFQDGISKIAEYYDTDYTNGLDLLKQNYDGYHFTRDVTTDIYNPFSVILAFSNKEISSYWFTTATPTFLIKQIRNSEAFLPEMFSEEVHQSTLSEIETFRQNPIPLLFQTGYLTVKAYDKSENTYTLGIPNREVREGLCTALLGELMNTGSEANFKHLLAIRKAFRAGNPDEALERVKTFLAGIPYELSGNKPEIYFENNLYLLFNLVGINAHVEWHTARGRIDILLDMPTHIYVMELKLDGTADQALRQIDEKGYAEQFAADSRPVTKIGLSFSSATRNIDNWTIKSFGG